MANLNVVKLVLTVLLMHCFVSQSRVAFAATHRCASDGTVKELQLQSDSDEAETLSTLARGQDKHSASQLCTWTVNPPNEAMQLILRINQIGSAEESMAGADRIKCGSRLSVKLKDSGFRKIWHSGKLLTKAPLILPVFNSSQLLTVRFSTGASEPSASCGHIELSITIVKKGSCGRNMLLHRGRCLLISDEKLRVSDLSGTGAELAAISGMEQLKELLRDNSRKLAESGISDNERLPVSLDLSIPVRVGVVRCTTSQLLFVDFSSGQCSTTLFSSEGVKFRQDFSNSDVQCASVLVGSSGTMELSFSGCNSPARSLLSFSGTPTPGSSVGSGCWTSTETFCQPATLPDQSPTTSAVKNMESTGTSLFFRVLVSIVTFLILVAFLIVAVYVRRRRFCTRRR